MFPEDFTLWISANAIVGCGGHGLAHPKRYDSWGIHTGSFSNTMFPWDFIGQGVSYVRITQES